MWHLAPGLRADEEFLLDITRDRSAQCARQRRQNLLQSFAPVKRPAYRLRLQRSINAYANSKHLLKLLRLICRGSLLQNPGFGGISLGRAFPVYPPGVERSRGKQRQIRSLIKPCSAFSGRWEAYGQERKKGLDSPHWVSSGVSVP